VTPGTDTDRSQPSNPSGGGSPESGRHGPSDAGRLVLLALAALLLLVSLVPPVATWARRYESVEALQFSLLAVVVPALVALGAPWRLLGLAARRPVQLDEDGAPMEDGDRLRPVDRLAEGRRHHPEALRSVLFAVVFLAAAVVWRIPAAVDALARHPWLAPVEAVTLVATGVGLWLELVESPPLVPRLSRPNRVALAAVSMWTIWVMAYLVAMSHVSWYRAYVHHAGSGLSLAADQQLGMGLIVVISGCAFVPVVFGNLIRWLQAQEDPDEEMQRVLRTERIRGRTIDGGPAHPA